jgi:hypothetical protein
LFERFTRESVACFILDGILANDDGCPCNKPYTGFNVFPKLNTNSNVLAGFESNTFAQINVLDSYKNNMGAAIKGVESNFDTKPYSIVGVTNTTVDGFPAKLITVKPTYHIYLIGTGKWLDQIGIELNNPQAYTLQAYILNGVDINN